MYAWIQCISQFLFRLKIPLHIKFAQIFAYSAYYVNKNIIQSFTSIYMFYPRLNMHLQAFATLSRLLTNSIIHIWFWLYEENTIVISHIISQISGIILFRHLSCLKSNVLCSCHSQHLIKFTTYAIFYCAYGI